jgi:hypothetical protein
MFGRLKRHFLCFLLLISGFGDGALPGECAFFLNCQVVDDVHGFDLDMRSGKAVNQLPKNAAQATLPSPCIPPGALKTTIMQAGQCCCFELSGACKELSLSFRKPIFCRVAVSGK